MFLHPPHTHLPINVFRRHFSPVNWTSNTKMSPTFLDVHLFLFGTFFSNLAPFCFCPHLPFFPFFFLSIFFAFGIFVYFFLFLFSYICSFQFLWFLSFVSTLISFFLSFFLSFFPKNEITAIFFFIINKFFDEFLSFSIRFQLSFTFCPFDLLTHLSLFLFLSSFFFLTIFSVMLSFPLFFLLHLFSVLSICQQSRRSKRVSQKIAASRQFYSVNSQNLKIIW